MTYDYAEAVWNRSIDDSIHQLELGVHMAETIISELNSAMATCNCLRSIVDQYQDVDRSDVEVLADKFRDALGHQVSVFIRSLRVASDDSQDIYPVLNGFSN